MDHELKSIFNQLHRNELAAVTEIRIRRNRPLVIVIGAESMFLLKNGKLINHFLQDCVVIDDDSFEYIFERICDFSVHSNLNDIVNGYVTIEGGNRVGICSEAVIENGNVHSVKNISSINIRIAKEYRNCSRSVLNSIFINQLPSIIVAGPPASGKTTFLRDMACILSDGFCSRYRKVTVVDERREIIPLSNGNPLFQTGINTDILSGYPKAAGIEIAVRTMSPELIVCDEISTYNELNSISQGFASGIAFAVSVHAKVNSVYDRNSILCRFIETNQFDYIVMLNREYQPRIIKIKEDPVESAGPVIDHSIFDIFRDFEI